MINPTEVSRELNRLDSKLVYAEGKKTLLVNPEDFTCAFTAKGLLDAIVKGDLHCVNWKSWTRSEYLKKALEVRNSATRQFDKCLEVFKNE